jgi:hypothetical protein
MADGAVQSPRNRRILVGPHRVQGRAKGTYCNVVRADEVSVSVGVDAEGVFIESGDNSATITILLTPSSRSNRVFAAYAETKLAFPIAINEKNGTTVGGCARARFTKQADVAWSDGVEVRSWVAVTTNWAGITGDIDSMPIAEVDESAL